MSQASEPARRKSKPKGLKNPVTLISLIAVSVVTLIAAAVIMHDAQVSSDWDNSYKAIGAAMGKKNEKKVSRKDLKKYLRGSPSRRPDKKNDSEVFTWNGIVTSYGFQVEYEEDGDVKRIKPK